MLWAIGYLFVAVVLGIILLLTTLVIWYTQKWKSAGFDAIPPSVTVKSFLKQFLVTKSNGDADLDIYNYFVRTGAKCGGAVEIMGSSLWVVDPDLMRSIYIKDFDHFVDRPVFEIGGKDSYINQGVGNLVGQQWKDVRNVMSPTFTSGKIKLIFQSIPKCCNKMTDYLQKKAELGESVEMKDAYGRLVMDVIAISSFGIDCDSFKHPDAPFPRMAKKMFNPDALGFILLMVSVAAPRFVKFLRMLRVPLPDSDEVDRYFASVVKDAVEHREKSGVKGRDFLQLLLDARKGELDDLESDNLIGYNPSSDKVAAEKRKALSKAVLTEHLLIAQCIVLIGAGYDTTSSTLSFAAYEMAVNPDIQEKLYEEVKKAADKHDGQLTYDDVMNMELLDKIINETLRLHTIATRSARTCTKDYQVPGTDATIIKGSTVMFPAFAIHRDERYFPNPTKFDPERFSSEEKANRAPYIYLPFGHGPRNCIGMRFALMQAKTILAYTILNFRLHPTEKTTIPMKYALTSPLLKAKGGMWLRLEKRK